MIHPGALENADFNWTLNVKSVWEPSPHDVPELRREFKKNISRDLDQMAESPSSLSPLGHVLSGPAGSGKTHLLGALRRENEKKIGAFILADMTHAPDFSETILSGYVDSLQRPPGNDPNGAPQFQEWLTHMLFGLKLAKPGQRPAKKLSKSGYKKLIRQKEKITRRLLSLYPAEMRAHKDALTALLLLNSASPGISQVGYQWLRGLEIQKNEKDAFGFARTRENPNRIIASLSRLMSLKGPAILALDQLDSTVIRRHLASGDGSGGRLSDRQGLSMSRLEEIGGGLMALRDMTSRTLIVVSCLETTWQALMEKTVASAAHRFHPPHRLGPVIKSKTAESIAAVRLAPAYKKAKFIPPYPSWPFRPSAFETARELFPREILQRCDRHREMCLKQKKIQELTSFGGPGSDAQPESPPGGTNQSGKRDEWNHTFKNLKKNADISRIFEGEDGETRAAALIQSAFKSFVCENDFPKNAETALETEFRGDGKYPPLHARIQVIFPSSKNSGGKNRERHFCARAIFKTHVIAFQARLKAAMTASGIGPNAPDRRMVIASLGPAAPPGGEKTLAMVDWFKENGGIFARLSDDDLKTMLALQAMENERSPGFLNWLKEQKPATGLEFMESATPFLLEKKPEKPPAPLPDSPAPDSAPQGDFVLGLGADPDPEADPADAEKQKTADVIAVPPGIFAGASMILSGEGSGKNALVLSLVRSAAALNAPTVIFDSGGAFGEISSLGNPESHDFDIDKKSMQTWRKPGVEPGRLFRERESSIQGFAKIHAPVFDASGMIANFKVLDELMVRVCRTLIQWMKNRPDAPGVLNGLLIFDEASRFIPASGKGESPPLIRELIEMARKKGFGLIFATESPGDVSLDLMDRRSCYFLGKASSPAAINIINSRRKPHKRDNGDIPRLPGGKFHFVGPGGMEYVFQVR
ncbi:putative ATPase-like protein [Candidatus Desulfarcum epimagneticum]|uniref:Putative ATPase-like protein n=1 Tax=uncultured Desulfobacteraceae bacterium TaxID=218296 RepID=A0A484HI85_9BACT|nr:putative ATPase-like protein [uncultured Desulfobacteraceae bacterium]